MVFAAALPGIIPKGVGSRVFFFFWVNFCDVRKVAIKPQPEDLARFFFGYKLNMELKILNISSIYFWLNLREPCKDLATFLKIWSNYGY
jgi:hypothetical protein